MNPDLRRLYISVLSPNFDMHVERVTTDKDGTITVTLLGYADSANTAKAMWRGTTNKRNITLPNRDSVSFSETLILVPNKSVTV